MLPSTRSLSLEMIEKERRHYDTMVSRRQGMSRRVREFYKAQSLSSWPGGMRFPSLSNLLEPSLHDVCRAQ